jgi:hypothetical protein
LLVTDMSNHRIRRVTLGGVVTTFAGTGVSGNTDDNVATSATLAQPLSIALSSDGNSAYVTTNGRIRKIDLLTGNTSTLTTTGQFTQNPGTPYLASFMSNVLISPDNQFLYFISANTSTQLNRVNLLIPSAPVRIAGDQSLASATINGVGAAARFSTITGMGWGPNNTILLSQTNLIRQYRLSSGEVSTFAGSGTVGNGNGSNHLTMELDSPRAFVYLPSNGNIYFTQVNENIRVLTPNALDDAITKDDALVFNTGIAASQAGVDKVELFISGVAYSSPGSPVLIKRFTNASAASWNQYTWDTSIANTADGANYSPSLLVGGAGTTATTGQVDVKAYDRYGAVIGTGSFAINVLGRPETTVRIQ